MVQDLMLDRLRGGVVIDLQAFSNVVKHFDCRKVGGEK